MKKLIICFIFIGLATNSFAQQTEEQVKKLISHEWLTYSKAFELKDYNKISEFFRFICWNHNFKRRFILNRFECVPIN